MGELEDKEAQLRMAADDALRAYLGYYAEKVDDENAWDRLEAEADNLFGEIAEATYRVENG